MASTGYIIVGAEVEANTHFLQPNGTISTRRSNTPLDVEYIGRLMVELSEKKESGVTATQLAKHAEEVRYALQVVETDTNATMSAAEKAAIIGKTMVRIVFEKRNPATDTNERILTIPADGTLGEKSAELAARPNGKGFNPPLSYQLDEALTLASVKRRIMTMVDGFANVGATGWNPDVQAALKKHMADQIDAATTFARQPGAAGTSAKAAIMTTPVRAFHRAVGIYGTNMCR